jgi:hypothetical protein
MSSRSGEELLLEIAGGDFSRIAPLLEDPARARKATGLDAEASLLAEIAALAAVDAPPISWLHLLGRNEATVDIDKVVGALIAVTPIIGAPRAVSAAGNILGATEFEEELDEEP